MSEDPRFDLGLYALPEAARLACVPAQTVRNWVHGYSYQAEGKRVRAQQLIAPTAGASALSFVNLMEVVALAGFRGSGVSMQRVRAAVAFVEQQLEIDHALASYRMLTDGVDLFWAFQERHHDKALVNASRGGQRVFPEAVMRYLREVEWGQDEVAVRWWPGAKVAGEGTVVVDPNRAFGAPVIAHTGIRIEDVFSRFYAGEPMAVLADDYGVSVGQIEAAVQVESRILAA